VLTGGVDLAPVIHRGVDASGRIDGEEHPAVQFSKPAIQIPLTIN
jgi:hypothetical protein